ncbi:MAG: hypothetical protein ABSG82_03030 [Sedimentisphaerales bacterium]|jgi:hypothetical protein
MTTLRTLATIVALMLLAVCSKQAANEAIAQDVNAKGVEQLRRPKSPPQFSETVLCSYKKDGSGGFSPYWVAYIIDPIKDANDQSSFVELNGKRLGPYAQVSGMMEVSHDGRHMAFAAEKNKKWVVVVDGVEKFTHEGLLWPWCAWSPSLEGNSFIPQTRAALLEFSRDGQFIAYPAKMADGKYAVFVNGEPGPSFPSVGSSVSFVADQVKYYAFPEEKKIVEVHGKQVLGPYDTSYKTKVSADGNHYCFWATTGDKKILVVDDQTRELPGELTDYVIGNEGFLAYAYKSSGKHRVWIDKTDLPGDYDEVTEMTLSPDNRKVAFWARRSGKWTLVAGDKELPGFDGYFYYQCGGRKYSVMWSPDSQHIAYYIREGRNGVLVLDGQKLEADFRPPGLALQVIVDDKGQSVGSGIMQGPQMDTGAFVQAVLLREKIKCDPFSASLLDRMLCYIEKNDSTAFMHIGEKKEGPYKSIRSVLLTSPDGKHYAYLVQTDKGDQVVIDGTVRPQTYNAIYRLIFNDEDRTLDFLAVKDGNLVRVVEPL